MTPLAQALGDIERNPEQAMAVSTAGHCVVLAGPGSGKTKVLCVRLAKILRDLAPGRFVACLTYNNECVRELRARLEGLGLDDSRRAYVGTLHSFCLRHIVLPYARLARPDLPPELEVADESEISRAVDAALAELEIHEATGWKGTIDNHRRQHLDRLPGSGWAPGDRAATDICILYEKALRSLGRIDFIDQVQIAYELVRDHPWVRRCLRAKFPYLVVDEYQDLGVGLHKLVELLCLDPDGATLFAVGDPDQSVYGFNGARPALLQGLARRSDVTSVRLRLNYRCSKKVIEASRTALGEDRDYEPHRTDEGLVDFHLCEQGLPEQGRLIAQLIAGLTSRFPPGEIAVLYKSAAIGDQIQGPIADAGISFVRTDNGTRYPKTSLTRLLEDAALWCAGGWATGTPRLSRLVQEWIDVCDPKDERGARVSLIRFLHLSRDGDAVASVWLKQFESQVLAHASVGSIPRREQGAFRRLVELCSEGGALEGYSIRGLSGEAESPSHVNLLTLHSAKGREYKAVLIAGVDEGHIPHFRSTTPEAIAEERRVFYVGLTRAKEEVHLLCSGWTGYPDNPRRNGPSRFLMEVYNAAQTSKSPA
jgi:DNA helicase II / ATP-dependent DNA helicase PcrA